MVGWIVMILRGKITTSLVVFAYKRLYAIEPHRLVSNRRQLGPTLRKQGHEQWGDDKNSSSGIVVMYYKEWD